MILGQSQFGEAILGADLDEVSFKIYSEPDAVSVAVAVHSATMAVISTPTGASVTVTAFAPESNTGSNSFPEVARITVETDRPRAGAKSLPPVVAVSVAGVAPTTLVVSEPPAVVVTIAVGAPTLTAISTPTGASVAVAGVAPTEAAVVETPGASIAVAAGVPVAAAVSTIPAISVAVAASSPVAAISSQPTGAAITVAVISPDTVALQVPPSAIVWVRTGVLVHQQEAAQGTVVVLNANTLAVSEYGIAALDVVEHEGELYFVTTSGLNKLSENGLENINSYIQTGQLNFDVSNIKYIQNMTVNTPTNASLMITGFIEQPNGDVYMFPTKDAYRDSLNQQIRIFKLPKGIRSVYWGFKFENDGTNTFELEDITLDILDTVLKR